MADGIFDEDNAGLAGAGHEQTHQKNGSRIQKGFEENGDRDGLQDNRGQVAESSPGEVERDFDSASPEAKAEMIAAFHWRGMLPHPSDFCLYPEDVQSKLVSWAEESFELQNRLASSAMQLDAAESKRLDKIAEADIKQIPRAQFGTIFINFAIIVATVVLSVMDKTSVAIALVGGLAAINVATLYVNHRSGDGKSEEHNDSQGD